MAFTPATVCVMIEGLLTELETTVTAVGQDTAANPAVITAITNGMEDAKTTLAALVAAESSSSAQPLVARIISDVMAVDAAIAGIPGLPTPVKIALQVVQMMLPVISGVVQVVWPSTNQLATA